MIISEARFAAAYVTQEGETRRFDDVGDMLLFHQEHQEEVAVFWVHDYETEEWVRADQAFFVMSEELITPMGYGIVAFADRERAEALAAETQGMVMTFEELAARFAGEEEMHEHMHQHGSETEAGEEHR
jgi:copper chaperone NosL